MKLIEKVRQTASRLKTMARRPARKIPPQKLQARVRASVAATADPYDDDEPQTKLTSAFVVVLILHVVAVGGIYAFNQIKASRRSIEAGPSTLEPNAKSTAANESTESPEQRKPSAPVKPTSASVATPSAGTLSGPSGQRVHNVKPGDTLNGIAKQYGTTVAELKTLNSLQTDIIHQGQTLNLPSAGAKPVSDAAFLKKTEDPAAKAVNRSYTVKNGDRLIFIAKKYNVQPEELIAFNKIADPAKIHAGQVIKIPNKK